MTPRTHAVSYGVAEADQKRDDRIIAEYVSTELNVLRESGYGVQMVFDFAWSCQQVARCLAAGSLQSGTWVCEVVRHPVTHRPIALKFTERPS